MTRKPHGLTGRPSNRRGTGTAPPSVTLTLRIPQALREALQRTADDNGQSLNALAISALAASAEVKS